MLSGCGLKSGAGGLPPDHNASTLQKQMNCQTGARSTWFILAKERAFWARHRQNISKLPLHRSTWCLVHDPRTGTSKFELLETCQEKSMSGSAVYKDIDRGLGIHPAADTTWMKRLIMDKQYLNSGDYKLLDVISRPCGQRDYITVILTILNAELKSRLAGMRKNDRNSPLKTSFTIFMDAGGDEDLAVETLKRSGKGRSVLHRREQKKIEHRRRMRCKRHLRSKGRSQCEVEALENGISFVGSQHVYTIQKSRILSSGASQSMFCCARC
jgi:hypothetical protein